MTRGPTFMGIGAAKSGTTWLASMLRQHPDIWMPPVKELHYFDELFWYVERGEGGRYFASDPYMRARWRRYLRSELKRLARFPSVSNLSWASRFLFGSRSVKRYAELFQGAREEASGEITPAYALLDESEIDRIHSEYPWLRIVLLLRDPIERSWSHAKMELLLKKGKALDEVEPGSIEDFVLNNEGVSSRSRYGRALENWSKVFDREQIFVGIFDDLKANPEAFLGSVLRFLGVDADLPAHANWDGSRFTGPEGVPPQHLRNRLRELHRHDIEAVAEYTGRKEILDMWS